MRFWPVLASPPGSEGARLLVQRRLKPAAGGLPTWSPFRTPGTHSRGTNGSAVEPLADDPLGHGEVDCPARAVLERTAQFGGRADDEGHDQPREHLRASAQPKRVGARHPHAVPADVPAPDGDE